MANTDNRAKLQALLRDLFQFDAADLDFGIYRILNRKRDEIERFIEQDLLDAVREGLAHFQSAERAQLEQELAEKRATLVESMGANVLNEAGEVVKYEDTPAAQNYLQARRALGQLEVAEETEARIFNDLYRFFARYYDNGDFLTERRYSSREPKFAVPYNGEEVLLHWANRDQYYVKTGERFTDYRFTAGDHAVWFKLGHAQEPTDNVKSDTRYFVLRPTDPLAYDGETKTLTAHMEYRPLTDAEADHYLSVYNDRQTRKSDRRKTLDHSLLVAALEAEIMARVNAADVKHALARPHRPADSANRTVLGHHLNRYTARHTMDYFVHKRLGDFLRRELDFFLKNEVLNVDDFLGDTTGDAWQHVLSRARTVRQIAHKIIAFLAQIEDFQKRLFEKKKFVVQTDYCITLDRVPETFYPEILANEAQLAAWRRLYAVDAWQEDLFWNGTFDEQFLQNCPYMMVDTGFFDSDFKARLLATFDDLEAALDGLLLHSENFQALNLLQAKYGRRVQCTYIDPPYNTGNDNFIYKDRYRYSSWLTMMHNRLEPGRNLLAEDGVTFISIDDNEYTHLKELADRLYGDHNFVTNVIWQKVFSPKNTAKYFSEDHDYILVYARNKETWQPYLLPRSEEADARYNNLDDDPRGPWASSDLTGRNYYSEGRYKVISPSGKTYTAPSGRYWTISKEKFLELDEDKRIWWGEDGGNMPRLKRFLSEVKQGIVPQTLWKYEDVGHTQEAKKELLATVTFERTEDVLNTVKPTRLIKQVLQISTASDTSAWVIDFFAGSGTTGHAVIDLNRENDGDRKYILVEMGEYFDTMLKPRLQRVVFSSNWKDNVPQDRAGVSHMFKYQRLESYEDALNNIRVQQPQGPQRSLLYDEFDDYLLSYMLDFETRDSPTLLADEAFTRPFAYKLNIRHGHQSPQPTTVDLVETFHYLLGMAVQRLERHEHQGRPYVVSRGRVRTEHGIETVAVIWRRTVDPDLDLAQEADWVHAELLPEPVDRVYVNGESFIRNAEPLEFTFRDRMEGDG